MVFVWEPEDNLLTPPCGPQGWNPSCQDWWQILPPVDPSLWASINLFIYSGYSLPYPSISGYLLGESVYCVSPVLPRSENDGAGTGVDAVCTYHSDPTGPGLNRKTMYWELSRLTYGVSRLGPYTLDKNSLYVDGEQWSSLCFNEEPTFSSLLLPHHYFPPFLLFLSFSLQVTHIKSCLPPPEVSILFLKSSTIPMTPRSLE